VTLVVARFFLYHEIYKQTKRTWIAQVLLCIHLKCGAHSRSGCRVSAVVDGQYQADQNQLDIIIQDHDFVFVIQTQAGPSDATDDFVLALDFKIQIPEGAGDRQSDRR